MVDLNCVNPYHSILSCIICGDDVHTCEKEEANDGNYLCPVHPDGIQIHDKHWVCSDGCWEIYVNSLENERTLETHKKPKECLENSWDIYINGVY